MARIRATGLNWKRRLRDGEDCYRTWTCSLFHCGRDPSVIMRGNANERYPLCDRHWKLYCREVIHGKSKGKA